LYVIKSVHQDNILQMLDESGKWVRDLVQNEKKALERSLPAEFTRTGEWGFTEKGGRTRNDVKRVKRGVVTRSVYHPGKRVGRGTKT